MAPAMGPLFCSKRRLQFPQSRFLRGGFAGEACRRSLVRASAGPCRQGSSILGKEAKRDIQTLHIDIGIHHLLYMLGRVIH
jgi:hypothetical protein